MPRQMVRPFIGEVSGVDHPAHLTEGWLDIQKSLTGRNTVPKLSKEVRDALPEEARAYIKSLKAMAKAASSTPDLEAIASAKSFEKAVAALPPAAAEALLKQQRQAAEDRAIAKSLIDERETGKYEAMAKELAHLPKVGKGFATKLQKAATASGDSFAPIFEVLKAADAALAESGFFKEIGTGHTGAPGSAQETIYAKAQDLMSKDAALTFPEAVEKAATQNPDLVRKQRVESLASNTISEG